MPDLLGRPQRAADLSFECATNGIRHHRFTGPLLHDVLSAAGPAFDVSAARTGCATAPRVLLAVTSPWTAPRAGAQLVPPQDRCGARHISAITAAHGNGGYRAAGRPAPS
ncbi:hypothetical protein [Streptomyces sp. VRA16 Mangrove soil]|uniref:hypothetical protein n=1 Tax=Streptomyces sp. VRA16 Mangrove soil TaxID=2817434 RepID=UPI0027DC0E7A|nr:hypothetical protein [Streptomyces sp. VRA16 Mangrove soil]